jgi:hypothetical protein
MYLHTCSRLALEWPLCRWRRELRYQLRKMEHIIMEFAEPRQCLDACCHHHHYHCRRRQACRIGDELRCVCVVCDAGVSSAPRHPSPSWFGQLHQQQQQQQQHHLRDSPLSTTANTSPVHAESWSQTLSPTHAQQFHGSGAIFSVLLVSASAYSMYLNHLNYLRS